MAQGPNCPSDQPEWGSWCTCNDWKLWSLLDETETAVAKYPDCHCPAQGPHCHNNLYNRATWCTCKPEAAKTRRSIKEIQEVLSTSLKLWSRPFCLL